MFHLQVEPSRPVMSRKQAGINIAFSQSLRTWSFIITFSGDITITRAMGSSERNGIILDIVNTFLQTNE